jgi:hypothetical protein
MVAARDRGRNGANGISALAGVYLLCLRRDGRRDAASLEWIHRSLAARDSPCQTTLSSATRSARRSARYGGALSSVRADDLGAIPIKALMARNKEVDWASVGDVLFGCANQAGEDNRNVARMSSLLAGLPIDVPGATINRLCDPAWTPWAPRHAPSERRGEPADRGRCREHEPARRS